jgi:hypothetical protein
LPTDLLLELKTKAWPWIAFVATGGGQKKTGFVDGDKVIVFERAEHALYLAGCVPNTI